MDEVRRLLDEELVRHPAPPLGDLVERSIRQGTRLRRRRLATLGAGACAFVLLLLTGLAAVGSPGGVDGRQVAVDAVATATPAGQAWRELAGKHDPVLRPRVVTRLAIPPRPDGPRSPATPAGMLELLTRLLPAGKTSDYARASDGRSFVQVYLDRGQGPGMLRVELREKYGFRGTVHYLEIPDNCVQPRIVSVDHGDVVVDVMISSCLSWDGKRNADSLPAVTLDEATTIAADPRWGLELPAEVESTGGERFAEVPTFQ
ncbi:hypothetical protein BDK92_6698 [Micromonospora pisi]|uniref:Uncharacterized protein n=1 Tax=Micromonospora pisi TaxID=589240 RepID=A0A495JTD9_9ACTN|nr:hypothetical protein BDK92_6698 [Micromonospora pisi]